MDIIPHTSDEELAERTAKHKMNMMAAIRKNSRLPSIGSRRIAGQASNIDLPSIAGGSTNMRAS